MTDPALSALHASHDRLSAIVDSLTGDQLTSQSYDDDWTIAQVLSHLGSGSEIFTGIVEAGVADQTAPGMGDFQQVWARWDAMSPADQARESMAANAVFLDRLESMSDGDYAGWQLEVWGEERGLPEIVQMRLGEHAVHAWDVAVSLSDAETLASDAVVLLVPALPGFVPHAGKAVDESARVRVLTHDPDMQFVLTVGPDGVELSPAGDDAPSDAANTDGELELSGEAFIRLITGRLDPDHTPPLRVDGVDLDLLRKAFPGL